MDDPFVKRTRLDLPEIFTEVAKLPKTGKVTTDNEMFTYLNIDDAYITHLFPLLEYKFSDIVQPDYFGANSVGAHISAIYPNENTPIRREDIGKEYSFTVKTLSKAELGAKHYYVLLVECPDLLALRHKYGLPDQLNLNGSLIDLHITIATSN